MATTKRLYVFATFWLACAATALVVAAFSTGAWLTAELQPPADSPYGFHGDISYGLYTGSFRRGALGAVDQGATSTIHIACLAEQNACAWSCKETEEQRQQDVRWLLANRTTVPTRCPTITATAVAAVRRRAGRAAVAQPALARADNATAADTSDFPFINMGLWVSTQLFLSISLLLSAASAVLGLLNTTANPTLPALAVQGLFYWNGGAAAADLLILILWGAQFAATLADNVAFAEVISGSYVSDGHAALGYSYWLVLVAMFVSISSIAVLGFREYLLRIEPPPPTIKPDDQNTDGAIFLY